MERLKTHFITSPKAYAEGMVFHFAQDFKTEAVRRAMLTITALGVYEASVNGRRVGEQMFAPGFTYYHRDLYYQVYDVTSMLGKGDNQLEVYLGQGWYCGRFTYKNLIQIYGEQVAVSWMLEIEELDGTVRTLFSDESVKELESPYGYAGFYDGEIYYADRDTQEIGCAVRFAGKVPEHWSQTTVAVKLQEEMTIQAVTRVGDVIIIDFGQNFAGVVQINPFFLKDGDIITLRHGEILNSDGSLYTKNLRKAKQTIIYHAGKEKSIYHPRFTYMGFRYVQLTGCDYQDGLLSARALYSEMKRTGFFHCENPMVQQLYENQLWGQKSNYVEVPTDCPQRDERMGYTGDGQVYAVTGSYNYDTEVFLAKFLKDIRFSQLDKVDGYIGSTVPANGPEGMNILNMLGWGNAVTRIPEIMFWQYGTDEHLRTQYESMKTFVEMEMCKMGDTNLWLGPNLGDWLMPGKDMEWAVQHNNPVSNSFIVHDLEVLVWAAHRFGYAQDEARYARQLALTRAAYIAAFIDADGFMQDEYQGAYVMALAYVVLEGELRQHMLCNLVKNVRENGLQTGFFGTEFLLPLLLEAGETELAYDVLLHEECPGWMYQIKNGATTTWERWDALRPDGTVNEEQMSGDNMVSFNHYAFGSVGRFYYQHILGIQPLEPGFERVLIAPVPDKRLGSASGYYLSRAGKIEVHWEYTGKRLHVETAVPAPAVIRLPNGQEHIVEQAGRYQYDVEITPM